MDTTKPSPATLIALQTADLRRHFPRILGCQARMDVAGEGLTERFSVVLDIRMPQRQCMIAGEARHDALAAIYAAFTQAREHLASFAWAQAPLEAETTR
jgi:hypothetical protein